MNTILEEQYNQICDKVPIDVFLSYVSEETGWSQQQLLNEKDMGQIEDKLNVISKKPTDSKGIKRGKSSSELYKFVSDRKRRQARLYVDKLIG